jgi:hypothetical protein
VELKWRQPATRKRIVKRLKFTPSAQLHHYLKRLLNQLWNNRILRRKYLSLWGPRYKGIQEDLKTVKTDRSLKWQRFAPHVLARIIPELSDQVKRNGYEIPAKTAQAVESQQHGLNLMTGTAGD